MLRLRLIMLTILALSGCSSDGSGGPTNGMPPGSMPPPGNPPPPPSAGLQIASPQFTLQPGTEVFKCWYTSLPAEADIATTKFHSFMSAGSHHFIVYTTTTAAAPDGTFADCGDGRIGGGTAADPPVWLYASQDPEGELDMPGGVAMPLKAHQPLIFNMHYLNATPAPIVVQVWLNLDYATGTYQKAGAYVTFNTQISIPPGGSQMVSGDCDVPADAQFFVMSTHSHKHTVDALAARSQSGQVGEVLVKTTDWEHAAVKRWDQTPFLTFAPGEKLHYECSYQNDSTQRVTVGNSAQTNEMCMAVGYYFPATNGSFCLNSQVRAR